MQNRSRIPVGTKSKSSVAATWPILVVSLLILGCGTFTARSPSSNSSSSGIQAVEIARQAVGPHVAEVSLPQGAVVSFPQGALTDSSTLIVYQLKGAPSSITATGAKPVGEGYEIKLSDNKQPSHPVEIRLPIKVSSGKDTSFYTVYRSEDGTNWVDIGGIVEGNKIITWTNHFTNFWPAQVPAPLRPMEFVNHGWFTARVFVETYQPDPNYATAAPPGGVAVSSAPTAPGINTTQYLLLPVGMYTFCYDWLVDNQRRRHAFTSLEGLADSDPKYVEGARWVVIKPGTEAKFYEGQCPGAAWRPPAGPGGPVLPGPRTNTPTITRTTPAPLPRSHTPTVTSYVPGGLIPFTPTRTRTRTLSTVGTGGSRTPTKTRVNYLPYYNAWIKRCDDLRNEFVQKNCSPPPGYSGCAIDIAGMPTAARSYLYTDYSVNLHSSWVTFAQSLEDQLLAATRPCLQEMIDNGKKGVNLDVRRGIQSKCINDKVLAVWERESMRIHETSCRAMCGEQGKIGVVEGVPRVCVCK